MNPKGRIYSEIRMNPEVRSPRVRMSKDESWPGVRRISCVRMTLRVRMSHEGGMITKVGIKKKI